MHRVVVAFADLQDDNHVYRVGDMYPREGVKVSDERVAELASADNKRGKVLIEALEQPQKAKIQPVREENELKDEEASKVKSKPKRQRKKES